MRKIVIGGAVAAIAIAVAVGVGVAQQSGFTGEFTPTRGEVSARITQSGGGYYATFQTGSQTSRCAGEVKGSARATGNALVLDAPFEDARGRRQMCRITMTRQGQGYAVAQENCTYFSGASCEFNGTMQRVSAIVRWRHDGMAIDSPWVDETDTAWVQDQYGNGLVLLVSGCRHGGYDLQLGVRAEVGDRSFNFLQADPGNRDDPWSRELGSLRTATLRTLDASGRAGATITLRRDDAGRLRAELRPAEVSALRSASRFELSSDAGSTMFGASGSSRVIDGLECMGD